MKLMVSVLGSKLGGLILACLILRFWVLLAPRPEVSDFPAKRWRHLLGFRFLYGLLLAAYLWILLKWPLAGAPQHRQSLTALWIDDALNLSGIAAYLLCFLYHSYSLERRYHYIGRGFGDFLAQNVYIQLTVLGGLVFLRLDVTYLPFLSDRGVWHFDPVFLETVLVVLFILFQLFVIRLRMSRMEPAGPDLRALVADVAGRVGVKVRILRIWRWDGMINAYTGGILFPGIFLTELLVATAAPGDLRMVVGHECAHLKLHHPLIRIAYVAVTTYLGSWLWDELPAYSRIWIYGFALLAFLGYQAMARFQEFQADALSARMLGGERQMIRALIRIFGTHSVPNHFGAFIRFLVGHPDLAARVNRLRRIGTTHMDCSESQSLVVHNHEDINPG